MKVCVDPGHGMSNRQAGRFDPGATHMENGFLFREADIALRYGLTLRDVLRARGAEVFMTRVDANDHAPVGQRAAMARSAHCEFLVSLHLNDIDDDRAHGTEVLYGHPSRETLAQQMQTVLHQATGLTDRGIRLRQDLAVLKFDGPAVLIELGFIANDEDRQRLLDAHIREAVANAVASVVLGH